MHFYRARFLQAGVGRFGSEDPFVILPGSTKYGYALNNVVLNTDPTGEIPPVVAAILLNAGIGFITDVGVQLVFNGFRIECVDWAQAGVSAGISGALGGALGARSLVHRAGTEWSHWVPKRYSNPLSKAYKGVPTWVTSRRSLVGKLNGNYTTPLRHYRHDPFRYLQKSVTEDIDKYPTWLQQVDRVPSWLWGNPIGVSAAESLPNKEGRNVCSCE
jgi:hypothetical protein